MEKSINYFCHEHPLILTKLYHLTKHYDSEIIECYVCGKVVSNSESAYACEQHKCISSRFSLHKRCAELPAILSDPSHRAHPLNLIDYRRLPERTYCCDLCKVTIGSKVGYRCPSCDFNIHVECTHSELLEERVELQHSSHIHPLTLMRKQAIKFMCDGCGTDQDVDNAYVCTTCEYWVHKTCALLPSLLPKDRHKRHHHPLSLAFCFPMKHRRYDYKCAVCEKDFNMAFWLYFCGDCRYFAHLKCVGSTTKQDLFFTSVPSGVVRFPLADNSRMLIAQFVMRGKGKVPDVKNLRLAAKMLEIGASYSHLFNNEEYPWCLNSKDDKGKALANEDEELKICEVCITPISSSLYYKCLSGKYYIHMVCLLLPKTFSSSSSTSQFGECSKANDKNHTFTLPTSFEEDPSLHRCHLCEYYTNGMVYKCEKCGKIIDVKCAYSPTTIQHESHHHSYLNLTTLPKNGIKCCCCGNIIRSSFGYICSEDGCEFALDLRCAQLPATVRKPEWDHHPLLLKFDASSDHPSDFFCEVCEEEMHPKKPMYHCRPCDQSYHFDCLATESGTYRNVKFGRQFEMDSIHRHDRLTYNYITLKKHCDICQGIVYACLGFECVACYFVVCTNCGDKVLAKKM